MKTRNLLVLLACAASFLFYSCDKNASQTNGKAVLQVALTDEPGNYDEVNIDVQDVRINYSNDTSNGWVSLAGVRTGVYDILRLANGRDTILANAEINTGKIQQIRLILGPNNYVKLNGQTYALQTPSAQQSGLKIKINQDVNEGITYKLLLDFDASRSIVQTGNANNNNQKYILKPVIRATLEAIGGSVRGYVLPNTFATAVYALNGPDTVAGTYTVNGAYMLKGLAAGSYTISFAPSDNTYRSHTKPGVNVVVNNLTTIDTVRLIR